MAVGTAIGLGAAGLIGALVNAKSQKDTNEAMMQYQTSEREATQAYNNPVNQRKRFDAAGINPYFALGQMDAGNTTAQTSPNLQAPQYGDVLKSLAEGASNGYELYEHEQQAQQMQLGVEQMKVDTRYKLTEKLLSINEQRLKVMGMDIDNKAKQKQLSILDKQAEQIQLDIDATKQDFNEMRLTTIANRKLAENEALAKELGNDYQRMVNNFLPSMQQAQLDEVNARVSEATSAAVAHKASANLSNKQAATEAANKVVKELEAKGIKLDNTKKRQLLHFETEAVRLANQRQRLQNKGLELQNRSFKIGPIEIRPSQGVAQYQDRIDAQRRGRKSSTNYRLNTQMGKPLGLK